MPTSNKTVKSVAKKPISKAKPTNSVHKQVKKAIPPAKKTAVKKVSVPKPATKNAKPAQKKSAIPIKNKTPVKKSAKPEVKKAAPNKLNHPIKNTVTPAKKAAKPDPKELKTHAKVQHKGSSKHPEPKHPQLVHPEPKHSHLVHPEPKHPAIKSLPKAKDIKVPAPKPLVLPKITATRARKYEPEFTKSVLDQPAGERKGPSMRYSDQELNEFRELIQRKLETAKKELGYLQGLITRKDEMGGDDTDNRYMTMEDGSLSMEREQLSQMASRQITFIDHLEKAMMRIENKTYGICRVTGKLIDKARLRAVPHATLSIEAKMGIVK